MDIKKLVRPNVRSLRPYEAKETPARVKLDANESPFGYPAVKDVATNRYPDPEARGLRRALARGLGVGASNILVGNGSDELIYYLITTFGGPVMYPTPTFSMYGIIAQAVGADRAEVPLDGSFDLDLRGMLASARKQRPKLVFLSTPNNPTGNCFSEDRVIEVVESARGLVVVDEAYQPFSGKRSLVPLVRKYGNLAVMRTLSKVGLAALRVGALVAREETIEEVNKVRLPFNLNSLSQALAERALGDRRWMREAVVAVVAERQRLLGGLSSIAGVEAYPSRANFILFRVTDAGGTYERLLEKGVLVRRMDAAVPGCLRVTVGTQRENSAFLRALRAVMKKG
jgi:histidinol-phosphate aminotransferase